MNKIKLTEAGIDFTEGIKRFAGNEALYMKYLDRYKEDTHFEAAKAAFAEGNYEEILKEVHAMKGIVGTLGMSALYEASSDVVAAVRGEHFDDIEVLMQILERENEKVLEVLS